MTPNPLRELARLRSEAGDLSNEKRQHAPEFWAFASAASNLSADQWEAIAAVVEAARRIAPQLDWILQHSQGPQVARRDHGELNAALAALDAATSQEVAGEAE